MLADDDPVDRVSRTLDLLHSDLPEENALAAKELSAMFQGLADYGALRNFLYDPAARAPSAQRLNAPVSPWRATRGAHGLWRAVRIVGGHVLVVRESGSRRGWFYPVVDGHHPSTKITRARPQPWAYPSLRQATVAAEAVVAAVDVAVADILAHEKGCAAPRAPSTTPVERDPDDILAEMEQALADLLADPTENS